MKYSPFDKLCWLRRLNEVYVIDKDLEVDEEGRGRGLKQAKVQAWIRQKLEASGQKLENTLGVKSGTSVRIMVQSAMDLTNSAYEWGKEICSAREVSNSIWWYSRYT